MRYLTRPLTFEARTRLRGVRREGSPFSAPWDSTLDLLERELTHLGVRDEFVMQIDVQESELKLNGELKANARPASPSVAISVDTKSGSLLFVCGKFGNWKDNVRAIALGLEALRKVERYGIVQSNEQYRGFGALPPGTPMPAAKMTRDEAARLLAATAGWSGPDVPRSLLDNGAVTLTAYRQAAKRTHPDAGGDPHEFRRLVEARDLLAESNR